MAGSLSYRDAVTLLGGDPPAVAAVDRMLADGLSVATGGVSEAVLSVFSDRRRIVGYGRDLVVRARGRLRGAGRVDRTRRLAGAHTVVVITAYFEALDEVPLPFSVDDLALTRDEQLRLAADGEVAQDLLQALLEVGPPMPAPYLPYEQFLRSLRDWYWHLSERLLMFIDGLAVWDSLTDAEREATLEAGNNVLPDVALQKFEELYRRLAVDAPEFALWSAQLEHQATRAEVRAALTRLEALLASLPSGAAPAVTAAALCKAYRAELARPVLSDSRADVGVVAPALEEAYLDPDFRVKSVSGADRPADEDWWADAATRSDLPEYLAGTLTSAAGSLAPVVVLGQPGVGKSALTKVLAARLPPADFLPVRVVLREVPAEADIQDQIEYAVRAATGERAHWPELVRSVGGALPVVLLDGFDELIQATGVSQSDYLVKVGLFQQREADQGRPVAVVVTSRTALADRARYPEGSVALRLEPFRPVQVSAWLDRWNRHNEPYWRATGLSPLRHEVVQRHATLATQPLLLLMLALYDAEDNALQPSEDAGVTGQLDETALYEQLLRAFAIREVHKDTTALVDEQVDDRVEQELERLCLVAFGTMNRGRQWITEAELDADLAVLVGGGSAGSTGMRPPLGEAERTLGRFFFIERAQALRAERRLQTYEFLHATFGEYLLARLTVRLADGLLTQRPALSVGPARVDDDLLYALLSWAPLSSRQVLQFVRGCAERDVPTAHRRRLTGVLIDLQSAAAEREGHRLSDYRPRRLPVSSRHGIYSANLVLLLLVINPSVTASRLFPDDPDPAGRWHRRALLWRSALNEQAWAELALAMTVRYTWTSDDRELEIALAPDRQPSTAPVDLYWHFGVTPEDARRGDFVWRRPFIDELMHKMAVTGGTNDAVLRHTVEPLVRSLNPTLMTFFGAGDRPATSVCHDLLSLWLASSLGTDAELAAAYQRLQLLLAFLDPWAPNREFGDFAVVVLHQLRRDAARLPVAVVVEYLLLALRQVPQVDRRIPPLAVDAALTALSSEPDDEARDELLRQLALAVSALRAAGAAGDLLSALVAIEASGLLDAAIDGRPVFPTGSQLESLLVEAAATAPSQLRHRAQQILAEDRISSGGQDSDGRASRSMR